MVFQHFVPKSSKNHRFFNGFKLGEAAWPAELAGPAEASWAGWARPGGAAQRSSAHAIRWSSSWVGAETAEPSTQPPREVSLRTLFRLPPV